MEQFLKYVCLLDDGASWLITGSKIWISGGDQDMTDNIVHLVLCRLPDAPAGNKGLSLMVAPKFLPDGSRNTREADPDWSLRVADDFLRGLGFTLLA